VAAVLQLANTGLNGIGNLKDAYKHYHKRSKLFDKCIDELQSIKSLVELVEKESALHIPAVATALIRLKGPEERLEKWLPKVNPENRSAVHSFLRELAHGSDDRTKLETIMKDLDRANRHLNSVIQIRHVGMSRRRDEQAIANSRVKRKAGQKSGESGGKAEVANMATPPRGRTHITESSQWRDSSISSTESENDLPSKGKGSSLNSDVPKHLDGGPEYVKICNNVAEGTSCMYNAPMERGQWRNMRRYEAEGNRTNGSSKMYNYEMSREDIAFAQAEHRKDREWELDLERKHKEWELDYERKRQEVFRQNGLGSS